MTGRKRSGAGASSDKVVKKRLASGEIREYRYPRQGKKHVLGADGSIIRELAIAYTKSPEFMALSETWQAARRYYLGILEDDLGWLSKDKIERRQAREEFYELRDRLADKPHKADKTMDTLRTLLAWAYERGKIEVNQAQHLKRLSASGRTRAEIVWTEDHEAAVYASFPDSLVQAFRFALFSGMRQADMCRLRWSQYRDGWIVFQPSKTRAKSAVTVSLPVFELAPFQALVDSLSRSTEFMLTTATGQPLDPTNLRARWRVALTKSDLAGEDLHWHDLRGTLATRLGEAGATEPEIASITGHVIGGGSSLADYVKRSRLLAVNAYRKWNAHMAAGPAIINFPRSS